MEENKEIKGGGLNQIETDRISLSIKGDSLEVEKDFINRKT